MATQKEAELEILVCVLDFVNKEFGNDPEVNKKTLKAAQKFVQGMQKRIEKANAALDKYFMARKQPEK